MKFIKTLSFTTVLGVSSLFSINYSQMSLYKDPMIMGRGGANIAIGGSNSAVFSNPAGLSKYNPNNGLEFKLLNPTISASSSNVDLYDEVSEAKDSTEDKNENGIENEDEDKTIALIKIFEDYAGTNNFFGFSNFTSAGKKINKFGFTVGALAGADLNLKTHRSGFSSEGLLEVNAMAYGGAVAGLSYDVNNKLAVGVGVKSLTHITASEYITAGEILDNQDDLETYLQDLAIKGSSTAFDVGAIYQVSDFIAVGASYMNIGGIGEEDTIMYIPPTLNIGASFIALTDPKYKLKFRLGADYIDVLNAYESDDSFIKRLRVGGDVDVFDNRLSTLRLGAGLYQGLYTAGVSLRFTVIELAFATYAEEIGAYSGQDPDRRYMLNLKVGW